MKITFKILTSSVIIIALLITTFNSFAKLIIESPFNIKGTMQLSLGRDFVREPNSIEVEKSDDYTIKKRLYLVNRFKVSAESGTITYKNSKTETISGKTDFFINKNLAVYTTSDNLSDLSNSRYIHKDGTQYRIVNKFLKFKGIANKFEYEILGQQDKNGDINKIYLSWEKESPSYHKRFQVIMTKNNVSGLEYIYKLGSPACPELKMLTPLKYSYDGIEIK